MLVEFRTKKLRKRYENRKTAVKSYGDQVARKYVQRVNIIKHARNLEELRRMPGFRCHPLKQDRKGQWAINLTGYWRLIFTLHGEKLEIVKIIEVSDHYGD